MKGVWSSVSRAALQSLKMKVETSGLVKLEVFGSCVRVRYVERIWQKTYRNGLCEDERCETESVG